MQTDVVIVGGGIAGLACAVELCHSGLQVTVLEKDDILGGRASSWADETTGDLVDIGPHILLSEYHNMLRLMKDLGTEDQVVWQEGTFITLVDDPHPVDINMHDFPAPLHFMPSLLKVPQASMADLASNARLMWRVLRLSDSDSLALDDVSAEDYLHQQGVSQHFIDWFWRSACMSIMNVPLEKCSAGSLLRFFRFMIGKSGYQVGFAATGLGELYAPAAKRRIEASGGQVLTSTEVEQLLIRDGRSNGVKLRDGREITASHCVAALPPQSLQPLLPNEWQNRQPFARLSEFEPSPYLSVYLWFDRKITDQRFWAQVWSPDNLNYDFYDLSNIRPGWQEGPSLIASNVVYSHRAEGMSEDEIIATTLRELKNFIPLAGQAQIRHARVHRIPMAVPAPFPGSEQLRPEQSTPVTGLWLAGDWTDTGLPASMESAVRAGYLAAERLLASRGQARDIAVAPPVAEGLVRLIGGI